MTTITPIKLPRLNANVAVTDAGDKASVGFANFWNQFANNIETSVNGVIEAQNAAAAAQATATAAASTAASADASVNLNSAYTTGLTVSAAANGATAKINMSAHFLVYPDKTVSVDAGEIDGVLYSTTYYVYYDDPDRVGGAVSYNAATDASAFPSIANPSRHYVATATTPPTSSDPPVAGGGKGPNGFNGTWAQ